MVAKTFSQPKASPNPKYKKPGKLKNKGGRFVIDENARGESKRYAADVPTFVLFQADIW